MTKKWILICAIIPSLTLLAIAVFVWPTPYKYIEYGSRICRINRFTGDTSMLVPYSGWKDITQPRQSPRLTASVVAAPVEVSPTPEEKAIVDVKAVQEIREEFKRKGLFQDIMGKPAEDKK